MRRCRSSARVRRWEVETRKTDLAPLAQAVEDATPTRDRFAKELGEDCVIGDRHGEGAWEVRAVDKDGAPDAAKAHLLAEMFQDRYRAESAMAAAHGTPPEVETRRLAGRISMTGGWLPNAKDREANA